MLLNVARWCMVSCVWWSNAFKSLIIVSGCFPSWWYGGRINWGFANHWELRGVGRSAPEGQDFAAGITIFPKLSVGLVIELNDFEAENAGMKGEYLG
jgi:hypothetical protein